MLPDIGRRTVMKAMGAAAATGLVANSASASSTDTRQERGDNGDKTNFEVELELDDQRVTGWSSVTLPANRTVTADERGTDGQSSRAARAEWDDLTMTRGAKQGEMMLWDWRNDVIKNGPTKAETANITIKLYDKKYKKKKKRQAAAEYEFVGAWPRAYEPQRLTGDSGGDSGMAQEEITVSYERYYRRE